jgi:hypothetical protein
MPPGQLYGCAASHEAIWELRITCECKDGLAKLHQHIFDFPGVVPDSADLYLPSAAWPGRDGQNQRSGAYSRDAHFGPFSA